MVRHAGVVLHDAVFVLFLYPYSPEAFDRMIVILFRSLEALLALATLVGVDDLAAALSVPDHVRVPAYTLRQCSNSLFTLQLSIVRIRRLLRGDFGGSLPCHCGGGWQSDGGQCCEEKFGGDTTALCAVVSL